MKTKLSVLLLGLFLFFTFAQGAGEKVDSKKIAEGLQKAINNHDAAMMAKLYTEDAILVMSGEPEPIRGRKAIEKNHVALFRAFPDMKIEFILVLESGNYIVFEQIVRGTHKGPFPTPAGDLPATGRKIELQMVWIAKISPEGLIAEDRTYYDTGEFMRQLGLME